MPCYDHRITTDAEANEKALHARTDHLCRAMEALQNLGGLNHFRVTANMRSWWKEHKEDDAVRKKEDARCVRDDRDREKVIAGLSPRQRELLGVRAVTRKKRAGRGPLAGRKKKAARKKARK